MIVDSSAVMAILLKEPERDEMIHRILVAGGARMSAASYVECAVVTDGRRDPVLSRRLDELLEDLEVTIAPVTEEHARIARAAYRDFGRGSGHPAGLNFGDVFAYALAVGSGEPLLFKGDDFGHTDVHDARDH